MQMLVETVFMEDSMNLNIKKILLIKEMIINYINYFMKMIAVIISMMQPVK